MVESKVDMAQECKTIMNDLWDLAKDCEECADGAEKNGDEGLKRAWFSVAYRVRHVASRLVRSGRLE